jgi:hypothetical protein
MNEDLPFWYVTPQEFLDIVLQSIVDTSYFSLDDKAHPEDIACSVSSIMPAVVNALEHFQKKNNDTNKKAFMYQGNLSK